MKYLKSYERFESDKNWKIGDTVVSLYNHHYKRCENDKYNINIGNPYKIIDIKDDMIMVDSPYGEIEKQFISKQYFVTPDEYEAMKDQKKYNL